MDTTTKDLAARLRDHARRMPYLDAGTLESIRADVAAAADALAAAPPADLVVFRKRAQDLALYAFSRHGDDAYLYNALADIGGVSSDGKGWLPQSAPPADLVALVLEWQSAMHGYSGAGDCVRVLAEAQARLLAWRPSAPPEPHHAAIPNTEQA